MDFLKSKNPQTSSPAYSAIAQQEAVEWKECSSATSGSEDGVPEKPTETVNGLLIVLSLIIGLALGVGLETYQSSYFPVSVPDSFGSYATGFATEQLLPPEIIDLEIRKFGGNPFFLSNGTEVVQLDPRVPTYVGEPSPTIDDAWEYLIEARYFRITEAEAKALWGSQYMDYILHDHDGTVGGFLGGFDVFHSLHCLNELRKKLSNSNNYYTKLRGKLHDMHCINHLRQALQCASVASIIPSLYRPTLDNQYSDAGQPHVCRDIGAIHNYTRKRVADSGTSVMEWRNMVY
ncbi:unnamed protein product [Zymoseptoria tritici ST99CH_3D1]|nr:unnamed protein product [Zymoseptoria tritici ST99CH_3D1]